MPATLFTHPREIEFLGEKFFVPNPPEEYLRLKYGAQWMVPRKAGEYEEDVVAHNHDDLPEDHPHVANGNAHAHSFVIDDDHRKWPKP